MSQTGTERRKAVRRRGEQETLESGRLAEMAGKLAGVGYWRYCVATGQTIWSEPVYAVHGRSPDQTPGTVDEILGAYHPDDADELKAAVAHALATGEGYAIDARIVRPDGEVREVVGQGVCEVGADGTVTHLFGTLMDVTDQRRAERRLAETVRLAELASRQAGVGYCRYAIASDRFEWSDVTYSIFGRAPGDPPRSVDEYLQIYHPDDRDRVRAIAMEAMRTGENYVIDARIVLPGGEVREVVGHGSCEADAEGRVTHLVASYMDVTEQRASQRKVEDAARLAELAGRLAGVGHWRVDLKTHLCHWSDLVREIYGYAGTEPISYDEALARYHPGQGDLLREAWNPDNPDCAMSAEFELRREDGDVRIVAIQGVLERDADGQPASVFGTMIDVTEKRRAEEELRRSEALYRLLAENATDVIGRVGLEGETLFVTPSSTQVMGIPPEQAIGTKTLSRVHPEDGANLVAGYRRVMNGGEPERIEYRFRHGDGHWVWLEACPRLVRDEQGNPREFIDVARDVTTRKQMEAELTAARQAAEAAAEAKAQFLANMSHELRTPITAVLGFTELLQRRAVLDEEGMRYLDRIACGGRALLATINDVLDFSKLEAGRVELVSEPFAPDAVAAEALALFEVEAGRKGVAISFERGRPLPAWGLGDADRMRQVLLNLIGNAVKFTQAGTVTLRADYADGEARFEVLDTGAGIPAERLDRLFQRFSQVDGSTARQYGGTGLGLAICKALVEAMGGGIGVESAPGQGSRFWFTVPLPACSAPATIAAPVRPEGQAGLRVLLVDDNAANRELVRTLLRAAEAEVSEAADGFAAIEAATGQDFDLILMDLRMPGCDGREAARRIRCGGPNADTRMLAFSADGETDLTGEDAALFDARLSKPLKPAELLQALADAAAQPQPARRRATA